MILQNLLQKTINRLHLSSEEAEVAMQLMCYPESNTSQIAALLSALQTKGETKEELLGFINYLRSKIDLSTEISGLKVLDICGTGGDGKNTFNISTAAALLLASLGVLVAKHGGGAVSSKCGSTDVLQKLGIHSSSRYQIRKSLLQQNFVFLNASDFNPCLHQIRSIRKALGIRTAFNVIGPLLNPLRIKQQVVGVYSKHLLHPVAELLLELGVHQAMVVHSQDGLDELSTTAANNVLHVKNGKIDEFILTAQECGLQTATLDEIRGGDKAHNAQIIQSIFRGESSPYSDVVTLNAAAGLIVYGITDDFPTAVKIAQQAFANGSALKFLQKIENNNNE